VPENEPRLEFVFRLWRPFWFVGSTNDSCDELRRWLFLLVLGVEDGIEKRDILGQTDAILEAEAGVIVAFTLGFGTLQIKG